MLEIGWQVPGHAVVEADHAVLREGGDHGEGKAGLIHGGENSRAIQLAEA